MHQPPEGPKFYVTQRVKEAQPPSPLRGEAYDYHQLTPNERMGVTHYLNFEIPLSVVPERGRVFLRRYHKED
jgi:hypothetical protein